MASIHGVFWYSFSLLFLFYSNISCLALHNTPNPKPTECQFETITKSLKLDNCTGDGNTHRIEACRVLQNMRNIICKNDKLKIVNFNNSDSILNSDVSPKRCADVVEFLRGKKLDLKLPGFFASPDFCFFYCNSTKTDDSLCSALFIGVKILGNNVVPETSKATNFVQSAQTQQESNDKNKSIQKQQKNIHGNAVNNIQPSQTETGADVDVKTTTVEDNLPTESSQEESPNEPTQPSSGNNEKTAGSATHSGSKTNAKTQETAVLTQSENENQIDTKTKPAKTQKSDSAKTSSGQNPFPKNEIVNKSVQTDPKKAEHSDLTKPPSTQTEPSTITTTTEGVQVNPKSGEDKKKGQEGIDPPIDENMINSEEIPPTLETKTPSKVENIAQLPPNQLEPSDSIEEFDSKSKTTGNLPDGQPDDSFEAKDVDMEEPKPKVKSTEKINMQNVVNPDGIRRFPEYEDSHFFIYFVTAVVLCAILYLAFHNKQKIIALIVEGRHERRRRPHNVSYKKLDSNLDEVLSGKGSSVTTPAHIIY